MAYWGNSVFKRCLKEPVSVVILVGNWYRIAFCCRNSYSGWDISVRLLDSGPLQNAVLISCSVNLVLVPKYVSRHIVEILVLVYLLLKAKQTNSLLCISLLYLISSRRSISCKTWAWVEMTFSSRACFLLILEGLSLLTCSACCRACC